MKKVFDCNCEELLSVVCNSKVLLYGAGNYAHEINDYFRDKGVSVCGFAVSTKEGNPERINGITVKEYITWINDLKETVRDTVLIIAIDQGERIFGNSFDSDGWKKIVFSTPRIIKEILIYKLEKVSRETVVDSRIIDVEYPSLEPGFLMICDSSSTPIARSLLMDINPGCIESFKRCTMTEFSKIYGDMQYISNEGMTGFFENPAAVYIVTSANNKTKVSLNLPTGYELIQGGTVLAEKKMPCLHDDTGDNISEKNCFYSECSVHYWVWKNVKDREYVGVSHYRRQQRFGDGVIEWMKNNDVDIILSMPQFVARKLEEFYSLYIDKDYWRIMREAFAQINKDYLKYFDMVRDGQFYFPCNILFAKKEAFDEYCKFLFDVTEKIETIVSESEIQAPKSYMGYLTEIIESVYVAIHKGEVRFAYSDVKYYVS